MPSPSLVVCPLSVTPAWMQEIQRWCPSLIAVLLHGNENSRNEIKQNIDREKIDIILVTYETLISEIAWLRSKWKFGYLILDEAHRIKNHQSVLSKTILDIKCVAKIFITGIYWGDLLFFQWSSFPSLFVFLFNFFRYVHVFPPPSVDSYLWIQWVYISIS